MPKILMHCFGRSETLGYRFPIRVCLFDIVLRLGFKFFGRLGVPVEIEFTVDDFECLRIYTGSLAGR